MKVTTESNRFIRKRIKQMNLLLIIAIYTTSSVQLDTQEIRTFQEQSLIFSQNKSDLNLALLYSVRLLWFPLFFCTSFTFLLPDLRQRDNWVCDQTRNGWSVIIWLTL